jgi:6-phosphogluconolactonase
MATIDQRYAYVGSNSRIARENGGDPDTCGISVYAVNESSGSLQLVQQVPSDNPFFFTFHPSGSFAYVVNLIDDFEGAKSGSVEAYAVDPATGRLSFINRQATRGTSPCHLAIDSTGQYLVIANYGTGTWVVLPIASDGSLGEVVHEELRVGSGPNTQRQDASHPHAITADPSGKFLIAADLGTDRVIVFQLDTTTGRLRTITEAKLAPGAGPRHVAFNASGDRLYVLNELNATITLFGFDPETGAIGAEVQTILTIQPEAVGPMTTAEIFLHPSGEFLLNTNRGQPISITPESDAIVTFRVDQETGRLTLVGHTMDGIGVPWNFDFNRDGSRVYVPNFKNDTLTVYDFDLETGSLTKANLTVETPKPFCLIMHP